MSKQHTPGPWLVLAPYTGTSRYPIGVQRGDGAQDIIGEFNGQGGVGDEVTANARLAAAAPDLLAALELVYEAMIHSLTFSAPYKSRDGWEFSPEGKARAAIAKAKGHSA